MDTVEARAILDEHLDAFRRRTYDELVGLIGEPQIIQFAKYQIEIEVFWDDRKGGNLRVMGGVDDGGLRTLLPLTDSFIMRPDGTFVDG